MITSRKFIRQQGNQVQAAIDNVFDKGNASSDDVLYHLPITKAWIFQLVAALILLGNASYRHIAMLIKDLFDYTISPASINAIFNQAFESSQLHNAAEDFSMIEITANDELFHHYKPILSGVHINP